MEPLAAVTSTEQAAKLLEQGDYKTLLWMIVLFLVVQIAIPLVQRINAWIKASDDPVTKMDKKLDDMAATRHNQNTELLLQMKEITQLLTTMVHKVEQGVPNRLDAATGKRWFAFVMQSYVGKEFYMFWLERERENNFDKDYDKIVSKYSEKAAELARKTVSMLSAVNIQGDPISNFFAPNAAHGFFRHLCQNLLAIQADNSSERAGWIKDYKASGKEITLGMRIPKRWTEMEVLRELEHLHSKLLSDFEVYLTTGQQLTSWKPAYELFNTKGGEIEFLGGEQ
jgi:hypothetical protein